MLSDQAAYLTDNYDIIHHLPNRSSGFSATLMQNKTTGEYTLSFRSTEFRDEINGGDKARDAIGADKEITLSGFALGQLMQMEDYYKFLVDENIISADTMLDITGYSLGGQLASAFTVMHPQVVNQAYVFNGVGLGDFDISVGSLSDMVGQYRDLLQQEAQRLGESLSADLQTVDNRIDVTANIPLVPSSFNKTASNPFGVSDLPNLYSTQSHYNAAQAVYENFGTQGANFLPGQTDTDKALNSLGDGIDIDSKLTQIFGSAAHNDFQLVANQGINGSNEQSVYIEDQPNLDDFGGQFGLSGSFGDTHSIILILDSLMLTEALQTLDNNLSRQAAESIYLAMNNQSASGNGLFSTGTAESRTLEQTLDSFIRLFVDPAWGGLAAVDTTGGFGDVDHREAYLSALNELKETGLSTLDNGGDIHIQSLLDGNAPDWMESALDTDHGLGWRYALVNLNPFVVSGSPDIYQHVQISDYQLYDAATDQGILTEAYLTDRAALLQIKNQVNQGDLENTVVTGFDSLLFMDIETSDVSQTYKVDGDDLNYEKIIFDNHNPQINGNELDDRIYAGDADNILQGQGGDDYIEGGLGFDTYIYNDGDGYDMIFDRDGQGVVILNDVELSGGNLLADNIYRSVDGLTTYILDDKDSGRADLWINNQMRIIDFDNGDLGIHLSQNFLSEPYTQNANQVIHGDAENNWIYATENDDAIFGEAGDDRFFPGTGNDLISGGDGVDFVDVTYEVIKNVETGDELDEQRFWNDLGNQYFNYSWDDVYVESGTWALRFKADSVMPLESFSGVSYEGQFNFTWDASKWTLIYTDIISGAVSFEINFNQVLSDVYSYDSKLISGGDDSDYIISGFASDIISGGDDADKIYASSGHDIVIGGAGQDLLFAGRGSDLLSGGMDNDFLVGDTGHDLIFGGEGDDILLGDQIYQSSNKHGDDRLYGEAGDDTLIGHDGNDYLDGGSDNDVLEGNAGNDVLYGRAGDDVLKGESEKDALYGGSGDDLLEGGADHDYLSGGSGNDVIYGGSGYDLINPGTGNDTIDGGTGIDHYYFNRGDGQDVIYESSIGNKLFFGHGIKVTDVSMNFTGEETLVLEYGVNDRITIENFKTNLFTDMTFADDPDNVIVFSSLLPARILDQSFYASFDSSFFDSQIQNYDDLKISSFDEGIAFFDANPANSTADDQRLRDLREDFYAQSFYKFTNLLLENGFSLNAEGTLEKLDGAFLAQVSGGLYFSEGHNVMNFSHDIWDSDFVEYGVIKSERPNAALTYQPDLSTLLDDYIYNKDERSLAEYFQLPEGSAGIALNDAYVVKQTDPVTQTMPYILFDYNLSHHLVSGTDGNDIYTIFPNIHSTVTTGAGDDYLRAHYSNRSTLNDDFSKIRMPFDDLYNMSNFPGAFLDTGSGDDYLMGSPFSDFLIGGVGNDVIQGIWGNDSYYFTVNSGHDIVYDSGELSDEFNNSDRIILGEGLVFSDLTFSLKTMLFETPTSYELPTDQPYSIEYFANMPHQALSFSWDSDNSITVVLPYTESGAGYGIDQIEFSDGSVYQFADILEYQAYESGVVLNPDLHLENQIVIVDDNFSGGPGDDVLIGDINADGVTLLGGYGNDQLYGTSADDTLIGSVAYSYTYDYAGIEDADNYYEAGKGNDVVMLSGGDDYIVYREGDGYDRVFDTISKKGISHLLYKHLITDEQYLDYQSSGRDTVIFPDMNVDDFNVIVQHGEIIFRENNSIGQSLSIRLSLNQFNQLSTVAFSDGTVWERNLDEIEAELYPLVDNMAAASVGFHLIREAAPSLQDPFVDILPEWIAASSYSSLQSV